MTATRFFPFQLSRDDAAAAVAAMRPDGAAPGPAEEVKPIEEVLAESFNANNAVMAYVQSMLGCKLPDLPDHAWYKTFREQFTDAKIHAMDWENTVTPGLIGIPTGILNFAPMWSLNTRYIADAIDVIEKDPKNPEARETIRRSLDYLRSAVSEQLAKATDFQKTIEGFAGKLTADAAKMQTAIGEAKKQAGYDQAAVKKLTEAVAALNREIATWQTVVTAAAIAAGVSFWVGAVIAIFTLGFGLAFGIIGAVAGIVTMIVGQQKIKVLAAQVEAAGREMTDLNRQIGLLSVLGDNLNTLITLSGKAGEQVKLIMAAWQQLEAELGTVISDLDHAKGDLSKMDLPGLKFDMIVANEDWQALQKFCSVIAGIHYNQASPATAPVISERAEEPALV